MLSVERIKFGNDTDGSISHIVCYLQNNNLFDIEIFDFYYWLIENTPNLREYSNKFETWDELTKDLKSLSFDFLGKCEEYINNEFTENEIKCFIYN